MIMLAATVQLALLVGVIAFAVRVLQLLGEMAEALQHSAKSQAKLVELLASKQKSD